MSKGPDILPSPSFLNHQGVEDTAMKYVYQREMLHQGVFAPFLSFALPHGDKKVVYAFMKAFEAAVSALQEAVGDKETLSDLREKIKPVFRRYN